MKNEETGQPIRKLVLATETVGEVGSGAPRSTFMPQTTPDCNEGPATSKPKGVYPPK
jgi:hypothetical protein